MSFAASKYADNNVYTGSATTQPTIDDIISAFEKIRVWGNDVKKVFMNAKNFSFLMKAGRDYLSFEIQTELMRSGVYALIYGAEIYLSPEVPTDTIYFVTDPEFFGVCPIRTDITVLRADDSKNARFGFTVLEQLGFYIHNAKMGLATVKMAAAPTP